MRHPDWTRLRLPLVSIGGCVLLAGCLVFEGKTAAQLDDAIDSAVGDSEPDTATALDPGIRCGANEWCTRDTVCCLKLGQSGWFGPSMPCSAPGTCGNFSEFACATARECDDGGVSSASCCSTRESVTTEFRGSRCIPAGACAPASLGVVLCAPTDHAPCPAKASCAATDAAVLPPGYYACQ